MQNNGEYEIRLYSTDDVCKLLHIGKQKCLQLFHQDDFPSVKVGRKFWIKADCLDTYLSQKRIMAVSSSVQKTLKQVKATQSIQGEKLTEKQ